MESHCEFDWMHSVRIGALKLSALIDVKIYV